MGPCTASSCCCQVPESLMGPCTGLPLLLSPSPHSAMCHFQVSSQHCWCVPFFCHRVLYSLHCCCLHRHTVAPHSGFGPVTAQMSEVCGDSKIDGTHLHVILTVSIISLPQQTPRAFKLKVQCSALI
ncbi:unnamed protein product [Staurois parvus]|uniref:Uncharacterized protein n=1 Tax=Staurois parvus TaxID=386267 RepID=A0ABN9DCB3_9NEOB|nr:unnamed protein product [Staurois parvus]